MIEEFRTNEFFTTLDKFRSPGYPDDVLVFFFDKSTEEFEGCWVRLEDLGGEAWLYGNILNKPWKDYGVTIGDTIRFKPMYVDESTVKLIYLDNFEDK